jgi:hypothetical protein
MKDRYLEVTFRNGRPLAAYLYLPRVGPEKSVRTEKAGSGLLVDYASDGRPIGIEITDPVRTSVATLNGVLQSLGQEALRPNEAAPLQAA